MHGGVGGGVGVAQSGSRVKSLASEKYYFLSVLHTAPLEEPPIKNGTKRHKPK